MKQGDIFIHNDEVWIIDAFRTYCQADVMLSINRPMTIKQAYEKLAND